ncbi:MULTISPECIES: LysM peptidoglycan-binding domain-containing protein [unclassified Enterococcus]|uniref:LysM peptidoglycan-binding domain-containing protein n=1 Tax=unclassified Enterococcus TaxID=2608891 RepID=UPI003D2DBDD7
MNYDERDQNVRTTRRRQQKEKMRKRMIMVGVPAAVVLLIAGGAGAYYLYGREDTAAQATKETTVQETVQTTATTETTEKTTESSTTEEKEPTKETVNQDLQSILTTYSEKITQKTPELIDEYHAEIQENQNGLAGLSTIANQKANALHAVANEGIQKMQELYHNAGSLETVDLGSWTSQLSEKYTEQVARISDVLLQSRATFQAETQPTSEETQETTEETTETAETTSAETTEMAETTETSESNHTYDQNTSQASGSTTVVYEGEGPNQIAERTGVSVDRLLELNGMTMDNFFLNPGDVLRLN